jgi:uncharacterized protein (DUF2336 family)
MAKRRPQDRCEASRSETRNIKARTVSHNRGAGLSTARTVSLAESGSVEACLAALEDPCAGMSASALARVASRFGHHGAVREALLARPDLPLAVRRSLMQQLSVVLVDFVAGRGWLSRARAEEVGRDACERAVVAIEGHRAGGGA